MMRNSLIWCHNSQLVNFKFGIRFFSSNLITEGKGAPIFQEKDEVKVILLHNLPSDSKNQWKNSSSSLADSAQYTVFSPPLHGWYGNDSLHSLKIKTTSRNSEQALD